MVLKKLIKINPTTNSYSLMGVINKFVKFLDQISSKKDIVNPNCPLNKTSHNTTADNITFKTPQVFKEEVDIRKFVKNPQKRI